MVKITLDEADMILANQTNLVIDTSEHDTEIRADERAKVVDEAIKILRENALISAMGKIEKLKGETE